MKCNNCNTENPQNAKYCCGCGHILPQVIKCKKCGFLNPKESIYCTECGEKIQIMKSYKVINKINNNISIVKDDAEKYGIINASNELIVPLEYDKIEKRCDCNFLLSLRKDGKQGLYDINKQEISLDCIYKNILYMGPYYWMYISIENAAGYYNPVSKKMIHCIYEGTDNNNFQNDPEDCNLIAVKFKGKWGYIDQNENVVIPFVYDRAFAFHKGIGQVELNEKIGFIDMKNKLIVPFEFDRVIGSVLVKDGLYVNAYKGNKRYGIMFKPHQGLLYIRECCQ